MLKLISALIIAVLPLAAAHHGQVTTWAGAPIAAFLFPMIGLTMAPIYPALNSAILSSMAPREQPAMVGLIVVFSALGGTTGSFIVGHIFAAFQGTIAFYVLLAPIAALVAVSALVRQKTKQIGLPEGGLQHDS